jgi:hypothetical protein
VGVSGDDPWLRVEIRSRITHDCWVLGMRARMVVDRQSRIRLRAWLLTDGGSGARHAGCGSEACGGIPVGRQDGDRKAGSGGGIVGAHGCWVRIPHGCWAERLRAWREREQGMRGREDGWQMRHVGVDPAIGRWGWSQGHGCAKSTVLS